MTPEIQHSEILPGEQATHLLAEEIGEVALDPKYNEYYAFFLNSSLVGLALEIDAARAGQTTLDVGLPLGIDAASIGQAQKPLKRVRRSLLFKDKAFGTLQKDPEFKELWQHKDNIFNPEENHFAELSQTAYAEFLAGDADIESKIFAVSPAFRKYIKELNNNSAAGPIFQRVLGSIPRADNTSLRLIATHYPSLATMDGQYFWIASRLGYPEDKIWTVSRESKSDAARVAQAVADQLFFLSGEKDPEMKFEDACKRAFEKFSAVTDEILTTAFDSSDATPWRQFLAEHFDTAAMLTSMVLGEIDAYDPLPKLERLKKVAVASDKKDWDQLAAYALYSEIFGSQILKDTLDQEIIYGNPQRALTYLDALQAQGPSVGTIDERNVFSSWAERYAVGEITEEQLLKIPEGLKAIKEFVDRVGAYSALPSFAINAMTEGSWELAKEEPIYEDDLNETLAFLEKALSHGIFPTEAIATLLFKEGGWEKLERLQQQTQNGNFDPENEIQRDIEFMKYLKSKPQGGVDYEEFAQLPFIADPENEPLPILEGKDKYEARAAAFEAARVYWIVKERVDMGKNVLVTGNERYGKLFVVDPLREELEGLGVKVTSSYVRSGTGENQYGEIFDDATLEYIASLLPDIIVVDGTKAPEANGKPRLSRAMAGYFNWTRVFNAGAQNFDEEDSDEYNVTIPRDEKYWTLRGKVSELKPQGVYAIGYSSFLTGEEVIIGDSETKFQKPTLNEPHLIMVNSTIDPKYPSVVPEDMGNHVAGYFDDPENNLNQTNDMQVFTKNGLTIISQRRSTQRYISAVQTAIKEVLPEMIMKKESDPNH